MADDSNCQALVEESGENFGNVKLTRKNSRNRFQVLCKDRFTCKCLLVSVLVPALAITLCLNIAFVIEESRGSQENCSLPNEERPKTEGLSSHDHRCLVTVEKRIQGPMLTDKNCVFPGNTKLVDVDDCKKNGTEYLIKRKCICQGFSLSAFQCKRDFDEKLECENFRNKCLDHLDNAERNSCSCLKDSKMTCSKCKKGFSGRLCLDNIETFTCDTELNTIDGMPTCNKTKNPKEKCINYENGNKLVCSQETLVQKLPYCNKINFTNSPSVSSLLSENDEDCNSTQWYESPLVSFLSYGLVLLYAICFLKWGDHNAICRRVFAVLSPLLLVAVSVLTGILMQGATLNIFITISSCIHIVLAILLILCNIYSARHKLLNTCSRNKENNREIE